MPHAHHLASVRAACLSSKDVVYTHASSNISMALYMIYIKGTSVQPSARPLQPFVAVASPQWLDLDGRTLLYLGILQVQQYCSAYIDTSRITFHASGEAKGEDRNEKR